MTSLEEFMEGVSEVTFFANTTVDVTKKDDMESVFGITYNQYLNLTTDSEWEGGNAIT